MPLSRQPSNLNWLSSSHFRFLVHKTPTTIWNLQKINLPGVSLPPAIEDTPLVPLKKSGDHVQFEDLVATFRVDENMINYMEIWEWLILSGFPEDNAQYKQIANVKPKRDGLYSPATLVICNSSLVPVVEVNFVDIRPIAISSLQFETTNSRPIYPECTVVFGYNLYTIDRN